MTARTEIEIETEIEMDTMAAILDQYPLQKPYLFEEGLGGMNNTTRILMSGGERFVLRIYNNHADAAVVKLEHELLHQLAAQGSIGLAVPEPVVNSRGETVTRGPQGKLASLCRYLPGERPIPANEAHILGLGEAAGKLTNALAAVTPDSEPIYLPYYEWEQTYAELTPVVLQALTESMPESAQVDELRLQIDLLLKERMELSARYESMCALPQQWIHGDLNFTNSLAQGDAITALLDFEFCTRDMRAMELAVVLVDLLQPDVEESLRKIGLFCRGYGRHVRLTPEEQSILPVLMKLRMVDVSHHFMLRYREGLDPADVWTEQVKRAAYVCGWVNDVEHRLLTALNNSLIPEGAGTHELS
ncbi:phosphotransferase [Paenibacillus sp. GCM10023252]|uniref:phosphotransferase n=1 Tax=Paenibacillus sp. GCM10023252 TaxID=3252649 RepID=UPI00360987F0